MEQPRCGVSVFLTATTVAPSSGPAGSGLDHNNPLLTHYNGARQQAFPGGYLSCYTAPDEEPLQYTSYIFTSHGVRISTTAMVRSGLDAFSPSTQATSQTSKQSSTWCMMRNPKKSVVENNGQPPPCTFYEVFIYDSRSSSHTRSRTKAEARRTRFVAIRFHDNRLFAALHPPHFRMSAPESIAASRRSHTKLSAQVVAYRGVSGSTFILSPRMAIAMVLPALFERSRNIYSTN